MPDAGSVSVLESTPTMQRGPIPTHHRTAIIEGVSLFFREAGPADAPAVVLLHGFPTSSHMYRNLIPILADRYRVIAPDYPGFGQSAAPDHTAFTYSFARYADLVDGLLEQLGARRYALYVMDYGAPVGFRLALKHPERISALIVQNGNRACNRAGDDSTRCRTAIARCSTRFWKPPLLPSRGALRWSRKWATTTHPAWTRKRLTSRARPP